MSISLSVGEVRRLFEESSYNLVPIFISLNADLETPVSAFLKVSSGCPSFLLESVEGGERQARYSFISTEPYKTLTINDSDPLIAVEAELKQFKSYSAPQLPSLTGGAIGYIGYDCVRFYEASVPMPDTSSSSSSSSSALPAIRAPDSVFMFCKSMVIFDHVKHHIHLVAHVHITSLDDLELRYNEAVERLRVLSLRLSVPLDPQHTLVTPTNIHNVPPFTPSASPLSPRSAANSSTTSASSSSSSSPPSSSSSTSSASLRSHMSAENYMSVVTSLKSSICAGDLIQAVPSQRCSRSLTVQHHTESLSSSSVATTTTTTRTTATITAFDVYRQLRMLNPSPYMFFLQLSPSFAVVGASPEQLVKIDRHDVVTTHPIAGTRRRGATDDEDEALAKDLLGDEKERAEHLMLVDLGRNDVGRVSVPGSVRVDKLMQVEKYSHVMHLVSHVSGKLDRRRCSPFDAFRAVFPAGTVTGAPKIRAMQLISKHEPCRRGIYGGAVGYFAFDGVVDTAIAIRTMVIQDGAAFLQAGAGIVYDSVPLSEHQECVSKMKALNVAIDRAVEASRACAELSSSSALERDKRALEAEVMRLKQAAVTYSS